MGVCGKLHIPAFSPRLPMSHSWFGPVGEETNLLLLSGIKPRVLEGPACRHSLYIDRTSLMIDRKFVRFGVEAGLSTTSHSLEILLHWFDISEVYKVIFQFSLSSTRGHKISF